MLDFNGASCSIDASASAAATASSSAPRYPGSAPDGPTNFSADSVRSALSAQRGGSGASAMHPAPFALPRPSEEAAPSASVGSKRLREPEVEVAAAGVTAAVAAPVRAPHPVVALRAAVDRAYEA